MARADVVKMLYVTAEMTQASMSAQLVDAITERLKKFPEPAVLVALSRCCEELKRPVTFGDIRERIDDGHPSPEVAWAMLPHDESASVVMTEQMATAWGLVRHLIADGEATAARMAFREEYSRLLAGARTIDAPARWFASLGTDKAGQETVLLEAARLGRLPVEHVRALLPHKAKSLAHLEMQRLEDAGITFLNGPAVGTFKRIGSK